MCVHTAVNLVRMVWGTAFQVLGGYYSCSTRVPGIPVLNLGRTNEPVRGDFARKGQLESLEDTIILSKYFSLEPDF